MKLVFYLGGPRAIRDVWGVPFWMTSDECHTGCWVARKAGARIPKSTYHGSLVEMSQILSYSGRGMNYTAILPIEVDE